MLQPNYDQRAQESLERIARQVQLAEIRRTMRPAPRGILAALSRILRGA